MKKIVLNANHCFRAIFLIVFFLCACIKGFAQNPSLSGFVVYANSDTALKYIPPAWLPDYGVEIYGNSKILSGNVGSGFAVTTNGPAKIYGNIHSANAVRLSWENTVKGNITVANERELSDANAFFARQGLLLQGNLDVKGSILINKQSTVSGKVTHPSGTTYSGPVPAGGVVTGNPSIPTLPENAQVKVFSPAGNTDITQTKIISPGAYGKIRLKGNSTVTFSKPGTYIFSSITNTGTLNKFVFDFDNSPDGVFIIQIHGDVDLGEFKSILKNGGSASRIYAETHGDGKSCLLGRYAWSMNNCIKENAEWKGTIYAPFAGINVGSLAGSSKIEGALWSGTRVTIHSNVELMLAAFQSCDTPNANAGSDKQINCSDGTVMLEGSSSSPNVTFGWLAIDSGFIVSGGNTPTPTVSKAGNYVLTVTAVGGCMATDTVMVISSCIVPYYPPPDSGKTEDIIGSELNSLYENFENVPDSVQNIYVILSDSVLIDVIALQGKYSELLALLQTPEYGLTYLIDNGPNSLIITGKYPIVNLKKLDSLPELINYCRPAFPPVSNSGIANSAGDTSLYAHFARNGFNVGGQGVKVGVISNSYNTIPGNPAQTDVLNGDLPGAGNPDNSTPVTVLRDYPFGRSTDEGRAMLQIVHDVAPKAALGFRTGFISAGDFAQGIRQLGDDSCNIIVDDVTYITEPFFKDGVVSKAVDEVNAGGVAYFTSAGNYGTKSYMNNFNPVAAPAGFNGFAHNFGGDDIYQNLSLPAGTYTIVLQWNDSIYSLNPASGGAKNDLDFYLTDNSGNILFGFNRNNTGGDPVEVMPFTATSNSQANIMVIKNSGPDQDVPFKYIIFRGEAIINEYNSGTSTIVGQANSEGAMTVGAVLYSNTPAYGVNPPTIASFSSVGGTPVNGITRNKPDFTGPNGVNTTVNLGGVNIDGDLFPNFFGTSAAAPHIAGVAALVVEARQKFYSEELGPQQLRNLLQGNAVDMNTPGFDYTSGYGFVQADSILRSFAAPTPYISELILPDSNTVPGQEPFVVMVKGNYLSSSSRILFRGNPLETTVINNSLISAAVPAFEGNPAIQVYTPPIASNENDGGYSDSLFFFTPVKKDIIVTADNKVKRYGEQIPAFTVNILVDSIPIDSTDYTLTDLGLDSIFYTTPATSLSNTGIYFIRPAIDTLDPNDSADVILIEKYKYTFKDGLLSINKLPLAISPNDTTLTYGDKIAGFNYTYTYPDSLISDGDKAAFYDSLKIAYENNLAKEIALADAKAIVNGRMLTNADLENLSFIASAKAIVNARPIVNAKPIVNVAPSLYDTILVVDIAVESIFNYQEDSASAVLVNAKPIVNAKAIVNAKPIVNGTATVNAKPIVNGSSVVNGNSIGDSTHSDIAVIIDEDDVNATENDTISSFKPLALITGTTTGNFTIVPGAFLTENFDVSYKLASLNITPHKLKVKANDTAIVYGSVPVFTSTITGYQYEDKDSILAGPPLYTILNSYNEPVTDSIIPAGTYTIVPGDLMFIGDTVNYIPEYVAGTLTVNPAPLMVKADDKYMYAGNKLPKFTYAITGFAGNDSATIFSGPEYKLDPSYNCKPGLYSIIPSALKFEAKDNYTVTYVPGTLCVNPYKLTSKQIKVAVACIETYPGNSAYKYLIHFSYTNKNKTPVFIPAGIDNNLKVEGGHAGSQPELFMPGTGYFDVYSNELPVTWTVRSYECLIKTSDKAVANGSSPKCNSIAMNSGNTSAMKAEKLQSIEPVLKAYPNPAVNSVTIHVDKGVIDNKTISLFDIAGKKHEVRISSVSDQDIVLNLSYLTPGVYTVRLKINSKMQVFRILKQ